MLVNLVWHTDCSADRLVNEWMPEAIRNSFLLHAIMSCPGVPKHMLKLLCRLSSALFMHLPISGLEARSEEIQSGQLRFGLVENYSEKPKIQTLCPKLQSSVRINQCSTLNAWCTTLDTCTTLNIVLHLREVHSLLLLLVLFSPTNCKCERGSKEENLFYIYVYIQFI